MNVAHIICRYKGSTPDGIHPVTDQKGVFRSGVWDFSIDEARGLIGGSIFFHERKSDPSYLGGSVTDVETVDVPEAPRRHRVVFTFKVAPEARGVAWQGAHHGMAWTGGIIDG